MEVDSNEVWHPYRPRVRDIVISIFIFYMFVHLFSHWSSYDCGCAINIQLTFLYLAYLGRAFSRHFTEGKSRTEKQMEFIIYILFSLVISAFAVAQTYFLSKKWSIIGDYDQCSPRSLYIILTALGYLTALRTIYVISTEHKNNSKLVTVHDE